MNKILKLEHEGGVKGNYTLVMDIVMNEVQHYSDVKLEKFHLDPKSKKTELYFEFDEPINDLEAGRIVEALQIQFPELTINFYEPEIE